MRPPLSCVPRPLFPLALYLLENAAVATGHEKGPRVSLLWASGQFFDSDAGLCPLARIITLLIGLGSQDQCLSHGLAEGRRVLVWTFSWTFPSPLAGCCCLGIFFQVPSPPKTAGSLFHSLFLFFVSSSWSCSSPAHRGCSRTLVPFVVRYLYLVRDHSGCM